MRVFSQKEQYGERERERSSLCLCVRYLLNCGHIISPKQEDHTHICVCVLRWGKTVLTLACVSWANVYELVKESERASELERNIQRVDIYNPNTEQKKER